MGLDIGTCSCAICILQGDERTIHQIPSALSWYDEGRYSLGVHEGAVEVTIDPKRHIDRDGRAPQRSIDALTIMVKELLSLARLEGGVHATIAVPAHFNDAQKEVIKSACLCADVHIQDVIHEPSAAALAYDDDAPLPGMTLVYDLGGGTLDLAVVCKETIDQDRFFQVVECDGDSALGGDDLDLILAQFGDIENVREAKHEGRFDEMACDPTQSIAVISEIHEWMDNCIRPLLRTIEKHKVHTLLLTGDGARFRPLLERLQAFANQNHITLRYPKDSKRLVCHGAAISMRKQSTTLCLLNVATLDIGIEDRYGILVPIIHRNSALPSTRVEHFRMEDVCGEDHEDDANHEDGEDHSGGGDHEDGGDHNHKRTLECDIKIYQGLSMRAKDNLLLGQIMMPLEEGATVSITIEMDICHNLSISAAVPSKGTRNLFIKTYGVDEQTLERMRSQALSSKAHPEWSKMISVRTRLETLCTRSLALAVADPTQRRALLIGYDEFCHTPNGGELTESLLRLIRITEQEEVAGMESDLGAPIEEADNDRRTVLVEANNADSQHMELRNALQEGIRMGDLGLDETQTAALQEALRNDAHSELPPLERTNNLNRFCESLL